MVGRKGLVDREKEALRVPIKRERPLDTQRECERERHTVDEDLLLLLLRLIPPQRRRLSRYASKHTEAVSLSHSLA